MSFLTVHSLRKYFTLKDSLRGGRRVLKAVDGIDFSLNEDSVFGLVGESGCGKSTVAKLVLRLIPPTSGTIEFAGSDISELRGDSLKAFRKTMQIIFQDPFASLNPRKTVFQTVSEPLRIHRLAGREDIRGLVTELLGKVGLDRDVLDRYPHEFSGGQRQRICIARALAVSPKLLVADEPLSALDVSIQAQILNLLKEIKVQSRLSFLFISHDLNVVKYFSDEVGVMYLGKIVEKSKTAELFSEPLHPYTVILLASAPRVETGERAEKPGLKREREIISGEVPSPVDIPPGCPFHPRCPKRFEPCDTVAPKLEEPASRGYSGRLVSCHLWNPY
ncbi:MAG TPA: oligopeptide/dipeptide ABC transporter ATP-binding protein [Thermodesulfovibrionales bacterium]|nr:oligopeptide/dipeptide ABC transporter ATP-binding protein [Thermodesulfovibrionales bacterium]